jgi:hypothetical protein
MGWSRGVFWSGSITDDFSTSLTISGRERERAHHGGQFAPSQGQ